MDMTEAIVPLIGLKFSTRQKWRCSKLALIQTEIIRCVQHAILRKSLIPWVIYHIITQAAIIWLLFQFILIPYEFNLIFYILDTTVKWTPVIIIYMYLSINNFKLV